MGDFVILEEDYFKIRPRYITDFVLHNLFEALVNLVYFGSYENYTPCDTRKKEFVNMKAHFPSIF